MQFNDAESPKLRIRKNNTAASATENTFERDQKMSKFSQFRDQ